MATSLPLSTVTWNTPEYLAKVLDNHYKARDIQFYAFIHHYPDTDDIVKGASGKDHYHVFIEPAYKVDLFDVRDWFDEVPEDSEKGIIRCLPLHKSKFDDWYLYILHDKDYLESKMQFRDFHYSVDDVISSDEFELHYRIGHIDYSKIEGNRKNRIKKAIMSGCTFSELCMSGLIPVQQIKQYQLLYDMIVAELNHKTEM